MEYVDICFEGFKMMINYKKKIFEWFLELIFVGVMYFIIRSLVWLINEGDWWFDC